MIIKINMQSEVPIYLQLRNEIVKGIGRGEFEPGESLPTVRQMATDLGINTMTVSKAYQLLKTEGFLETDRRKGPTICYPTSSAPQDNRFDEKLADELELLSAEAKFHGMTLTDFLELCQRVFNDADYIFNYRHFHGRHLCRSLWKYCKIPGRNADGSPYT